VRRAPFVIAGTLLGLGGVLSFHSSPAKLSLGTVPTPSTTPGSTVPATGVRSAVGSVVNYYYGVLSVKVTANGPTITNVSIASLNDGGNGYSAYVDSQSIPMLERQAMSAQSANIQGVSGASYTSQGFDQSLQSALRQLGL
jgi:uncharacterized protein with FMN-binding domain